MNLESKTLDAAIQELSTLRRCAPFRFGGKWFMAVLNGQCVALRSVKSLKKAAQRANVYELSYTILS